MAPLMRRCCLVLLLLAGGGSPAFAQTDFSGQWAAIYHEDTIERIPGPELGDTWFVVTTIVEDPEYLTTPFVTSTNFKKQPDASGWNPAPCVAR
jgi:hypothetical protein